MPGGTRATPDDASAATHATSDSKSAVPVMYPGRATRTTAVGAPSCRTRNVAFSETVMSATRVARSSSPQAATIPAVSHGGAGSPFTSESKVWIDASAPGAASCSVVMGLPLGPVTIGQEGWAVRTQRRRRDPAAQGVTGRVHTRFTSDPGAHEPLTREALELTQISYTHLRAHETRHDLVCRL